MFKPTEGMAETRELAWGADTDNMLALLTGEAEKLELGTCGCQVLRIWLSVDGEC